MSLHRKETTKRLPFLKYRKLINIWHHTIFCLLKTHQKKHVEVASIFHPSKLCRNCTLKWRRLFTHQNYIKKSTSKWHGNLSILTCRRDLYIDSTCWVCWYNRTKLVLVSNQNHRCFDVKFRHFDVEIRLSFQR